MTDIPQEELLEALEDMVRQHCPEDEDGLIDSMALSTHAEAMRLLARTGRLTIESEHGRRVLGRWINA